jgi:hypothetical protein
MTRCMVLLALALTPRLVSAQDTTQKWPGLSISEPPSKQTTASIDAQHHRDGRPSRRQPVAGIPLRAPSRV